METFEEFYSKLLSWEDLPQAKLITPWAPQVIDAIKSDFKQAVAASGIVNMPSPVPATSSNQSKGNKYEAFFVEQVGPHLKAFKIEKCSGAGYPDRKLVCCQSNREYSLELKATADWDSSDSNRCVLTCSSQKIRGAFSGPICHLLITICYVEEPSPRVNDILINFLEPDTPVNIRLEASVSQKILSDGVDSLV